MTPDLSIRRCPNCSAHLQGPYCSECGQHQVDLDRPFREIVSEGLSTFFAFDTRIGKTVWPLIRRPGHLTTEFLAGRRARYVHPFKLYFAFSLVFFVVFAYSDYSIIHKNAPGIISINTSGNPAAEKANTTEMTGSRDLSVDVDDDASSRIEDFFAPLDELADTDPAAFDRLFIDRLSK